MTEAPDGIHTLEKERSHHTLFWAIWLLSIKNLSKLTPSFLKQFSSIQHSASALTHTHIFTLTFLKGMNNSTQESGVCVALWHIAGTNLPVARGSAEWTQLSGWCGARAGAPRRQTDTAKELRQRKSPPHKHWNTRSHILLYSLSRSRLSLLNQGKAGACQGYATLRCQLQLPSIRVLSFVVFLYFFSSLASVALLLVHVHAVSPSMTRASHGARWTSNLANIHFIKVDTITVLKNKSCFSPLTTLQRDTLLMLWIFRSIDFPAQVTRDDMKTI